MTGLALMPMSGGELQLTMILIRYPPNPYLITHKFQSKLAAG